ncbi:hypothetical protein PoB_006186600 [Plakobranchus ocellatus]|uniref:BESS domain-containing protein n=1 Tax=Plakobranchus ocellatus TaxID=259542 RepID=A0AAV4CU20_9GAST|nr:hypothetical protein PoB_006186600 [Plakobranchus ocellatus]
MFDSPEVDMDYHGDQNSEGSSIISPQVTPEPNTRPVPKEVQSQKRQITKRKASQEDYLLMLAYQKLKGPSTDTPPTDEFVSFGQSIAHDLRGMSRQQLIHSKNLSLT